MRPQIVTAIAAACTALATAACGQPHHGPAAAPAAAAQPRTADLQGADTHAFVNNRHIRAFYALSVEALGKGAKAIDVDAYEQKSFAIFRAFGPDMGMTPEGMQDHLKLIPRQVAQIAKEDPHTLDSFDTFTEALVGPK